MVRSTWLFAAGVAAALLMAPIGSGATNLPACTTGATGQLVPQLSDYTVNQGLPTYANSPWKLTRAKNTLVRLYLTLPTTCTGSITIKPTSSLQFTTEASHTLAPYGSSANGSLGTTAQPTSNADPLFAVPSAQLAPSAGTSTFSVIFTATVRFTQNKDTAVFSKVF